jgi:hypothetical protein
VKHLINRARCRLRGHDILCSISLFMRVAQELHVHTCARCGTVLLSNISPLSLGMRTMAADFGMPVEVQRGYMN